MINGSNGNENMEQNGPAMDANEILDGEKRKFGIDSEKSTNFYNEKEYELPEDYGNTKITLLVQNPYWIFAFWEFNPDTKMMLEKISNKSLFIRMYYADTDKYFDTEVKNGVKNWYIQVPETNRPYYAEIGILENSGIFVAIARSNAVLTPADAVSGIDPDDPGDNELFRLSGGEFIGKTPGSGGK